MLSYVSGVIFWDILDFEKSLILQDDIRHDEKLFFRNAFVCYSIFDIWAKIEARPIAVGEIRAGRLGTECLISVGSENGSKRYLSPTFSFS